MSATGTLTKTFPLGKKKVFLPNALVTLLAPREKQSPIFARFRVPLTFNKFDLRDYLLHVYRVPVVDVRSQIRQQPIRHSKLRARIYRPPPIKTMTVQLTKPFAWPKPPNDVTPWRSAAVKKMQENIKTDRAERKRLQKTGFMPLHDEKKEPDGRKELRAEAKRLMKEGGWQNMRTLDVRFEGAAPAAAKSAKAKKGDVVVEAAEEVEGEEKVSKSKKTRERKAKMSEVKKAKSEEESKKEESTD